MFSPGPMGVSLDFSPPGFYKYIYNHKISEYLNKNHRFYSKKSGPQRKLPGQRNNGKLLWIYEYRIIILP